MYTRVCAGLVAIVSLRTALGSLKEEERKKERKKEEDEDEQFACIFADSNFYRNLSQLYTNGL